MSTPDWTRAAVLSTTELLACWHHLGLARPPVTLELGHLGGGTERERQRLRDMTFAGLRQRRLADQDGPCAQLAGALRLLADPGRAADIRLRGSYGELVAHGAMAGQHGVVVARSFGPDNRIGVLATTASNVPAALVGLAGPLAAGPARPVNIPAEALDKAIRATLAGPDPSSHWQLADQLVALGVDRSDANSLARMCTGITGGGQLGATAYLDGVPRRAPWMVAFHRGAVGDFLQLRPPPRPNGHATVTVSPVTPDRLLGHLEDLLRALPSTRAA